MASINYATREISCKIVYYGPGLSGKTTNLQIIHRKIPADTKSEMVSLATETDRTLFFDFLPLDLGSIKGFATKFQLYTVPGQVYYNATRKLVLRGVDGVVFVADSQRDKMQENIDSLKNLQENLKEYGIDLGSVPFVLQYNKRDLPGVATIVEMDQHINWFKVPTFEAQAHQGIGVFTTLKAIGKIVIDTFNAKYTARQSTRRPSSLPDTASSAPHAPQASSVMAPGPAPRPVPAPAIPPPPAPRPAPAAPQPPMAPPPRPQPTYQAPPAQPAYVPPPPVYQQAPPPAAQPAYAPPPPPPTHQQPVYQAPPPPAPQMPMAPPGQSAPHQVYQQEGLPPQFTGFNAPPPLVPQAPHEALPGLQAGFFTTPPPVLPNQSPGLLEPLAPPPPVNLAQVPGLQGFAPPPPPSPPSVSASGTVTSGSLPGSSTEARKKSRLDGTLEGSDLDAEIARYERELSDQKASKPAIPPPSPGGDPLAGAFLTPEELTRLQGPDSYPTRRMPLGPGGQ